MRWHWWWLLTCPASAGVGMGLALLGLPVVLAAVVCGLLSAGVVLLSVWNDREWQRWYQQKVAEVERALKEDRL